MSTKLYSWSQLALRTASAAAGLEGRPTKLNFVVTKRCYSRCVYCDIWKVKETPGGLDGELSLEEVKSIATANPFFQWIDFTGGEPTDRPDFVQVIQAFAEACPDLLLVHFPTNGIATKRIEQAAAEIKRTVRARLVVSVSIDGPPELNDRLRGIRNDFAHAIDTFAALRRLLGAEHVFVGMTLHGHKASCGFTTSELVERTFASLNDALAERSEPLIDWSTLHLNIPHFSQHYYGNTAAKTQGDGFGGAAHRGEIAAALRLAAAKPKRSGTTAMRAIERIYRAEAMRYLAQGRTNIHCSALLSSVYLSEKGAVYPCTIWDKPLGNVRNSGYAFMPIIEAARRDGVRRAVAEARCPNCWTPCEAYPSIAASPFKSALALAAGLGRPPANAKDDSMASVPVLPLRDDVPASTSPPANSLSDRVQ
ncbi:MAG TPA: radical SAM protein [Opitutaceae bacterium]|jgi:MoaA/NifB/PqqE/SkfB family radical SAM enzyme|nr:radical SAM protein [Opitutaceae bacterium]